MCELFDVFLRSVYQVEDDDDDDEEADEEDEENVENEDGQQEGENEKRCYDIYYYILMWLLSGESATVCGACCFVSEKSLASAVVRW